MAMMLTYLAGAKTQNAHDSTPPFHALATQLNAAVLAPVKAWPPVSSPAATLKNRLGIVLQPPRL